VHGLFFEILLEENAPVFLNLGPGLCHHESSLPLSEVVGTGLGMANLTYLVTEGQRLVEGARQRTADYDVRCEAWRLKVEQALKGKPLALARFRQAHPINTPQPGIPYGSMNDFALLRGRLFVLTQIEQEWEQERRQAMRSWVVAIIGIIGVWAIIKGWFAGALHIVNDWLAGMGVQG
jgi:hypothetical protein